MAVGRHVERVPADENAVRLLGLPQPLQEVREADERVRRPAAGAANRLRQRVVGAVRERVAVDDEQRAQGEKSRVRLGDVILGEYRGSRRYGYRGPLKWQEQSHPAGADS